VKKVKANKIIRSIEIAHRCTERIIKLRKILVISKYLSPEEKNEIVAMTKLMSKLNRIVKNYNYEERNSKS
jgi:hypothetical protein